MTQREAHSDPEAAFQKAVSAFGKNMDRLSAHGEIPEDMLAALRDRFDQTHA
jgi:hypothetical protein